MPKQPSAEARKNLRAPEVREGETWKQYIDRLRSGTTIGAAELSGIICATVLMGKNPDAAAKYEEEAQADIYKRFEYYTALQEVKKN